jgi:hypothetical protein
VLADGPLLHATTDIDAKKSIDTDRMMPNFFMPYLLPKDYSNSGGILPRNVYRRKESAQKQADVTVWMQLPHYPLHW